MNIQECEVVSVSNTTEIKSNSTDLEGNLDVLGNETSNESKSNFTIVEAPAHPDVVSSGATAEQTDLNS